MVENIDKRVYVNNNKKFQDSNNFSQKKLKGYDNLKIKIFFLKEKLYTRIYYKLYIEINKKNILKLTKIKYYLSN